MKRTSFKPKACPVCSSLYHTKSWHNPRKPMNKLGKQGKIYNTFRDTVARPYLIKTFGERCATCKRSDLPLDVDHIEKRGSHRELKYDLNNLQFLCRSCHDKKDNTLDKA